jgi:hypothetical protein
MEESEFGIYGYGCYREIYTWDDRTVAWWDDADDTWYLSTEVDVITPFPWPSPKERRRALRGKMLPVNDSWSLLIADSSI